MDAGGVKAVKALYNKDLDLITLHGKRPIRRGWVDAPREEWAALEMVLRSNGTNVGLRCGHALGVGYHGGIDIDIVAEITREEVAQIAVHIKDLLDTQTGVHLEPAVVTSGFGFGSRHLHVLTKEPEPKRKLFKSTRLVTYVKDGVEKTGPVWQIEWIGIGGQLLMPPSVHPDTGTVYKWVKKMGRAGLPLITLPSRGRSKSGGVVKNGVDHGAGATVVGQLGGELMVPDVQALPIAQHWKDLIESGSAVGYPSRSEALFAGLVVLCRDTALSDEYVLALLLDPGSGLGAKAREKGPQAAQWLAKQLEVVRARVQEEAAAARAPRAGGEAEAGGDPLAELHERCALVLWGGRPAVFRERSVVDPLTGRYDILSPAVLKALYQNKQVRAGAKMANPVDLWMSSPLRREYLEGARMVCPPAVCPDQVFNLWEGWGVERCATRVRDADIQWWLDFVLEVICAGDKDHARWVHDWNGDLLRDPGNPKGVALVLRSGEGTGKGTFCEVLGAICGAHYRHVTQESQLTGRFNSHFAGSVLVNANEMIWAADRHSRGALYAMVTDGVLMSERKGFDAVPMANHNHFIISGNMDWMVPAGIDARRWFVLDVAAIRKRDIAYFKELRSHIEPVSLGAVLRWYQDRKVSVDLRTVPVTEGLVDQKLANFGAFDMWWHEVLERGSVMPSMGLSEGVWEDEEHPILKERLHGSYLHSCKENQVRYPLSSLRFMRQLRKQVPGLIEVRSSRDEGRKRALAFPPLEQLRAEAEARLRS